MRPVTRKKEDLCKFCNIRTVRHKGYLKDGSPKWSNTCKYCHKSSYGRYRKDICSLCKFIPVHWCQLDVHHVDGNHENNEEDNLITLCANCHRLFNIKK